MWREGLDYDHGTGHGVGAYLGVHEGPQRIAPNATATYIAGEYGIRIENLQVVVESPRSTPERKFLEFDTLTLAPIDRRLIALDLLSAGERAWLDDYHARVAEKIGPRLDGGDRDWLVRMTAPLADT